MCEELLYGRGGIVGKLLMICSVNVRNVKNGV